MNIGYENSPEEMGRVYMLGRDHGARGYFRPLDRDRLAREAGLNVPALTQAAKEQLEVFYLGMIFGRQAYLHDKYGDVLS